METFEDEESLAATETDSAGVVYSHYNVQTPEGHYRVSNRLAEEFYDIVSEAIGHDVSEDLEYDFSESIVTFD